MTTLELFCKCFGWQGGTIHDAKKRFAIASMPEMDRFCSAIADQTNDITDIDQALWFMSHRRDASGLQVNAIKYDR